MIMILSGPLEATMIKVASPVFMLHAKKGADTLLGPLGCVKMKQEQ
jgi:hypothetical protein